MKPIFSGILISSFIVMLIGCNGNSREATKRQMSREDPLATLQLDQNTASGFAQLALNCIQREYPNKLGHVMNNPGEVQPPAVLHPAFYGCFDWHSAVHGHWMLVRLLKLFPGLRL